VKIQLIVSRTKPGTYNYMKLVSESEHHVILDRRKGDRRRIHQGATPERRHGERRRHDIMTTSRNPAGRWCTTLLGSRSLLLGIQRRLTGIATSPGELSIPNYRNSRMTTVDFA